MTNLTVQGITNIFNGLACWGYNVAVTLVLIFIIISGIRYMMAGGSGERTTSAKQNFYYVLIGALVIFGVAVIINSVASAVGSSFTINLFCN